MLLILKRLLRHSSGWRRGRADVALVLVVSRRAVCEHRVAHPERGVAVGAEGRGSLLPRGLLREAPRGEGLLRRANLGARSLLRDSRLEGGTLVGSLRQSGGLKTECLRVALVLAVGETLEGSAILLCDEVACRRCIMLIDPTIRCVQRRMTRNLRTRVVLVDRMTSNNLSIVGRGNRGCESIGHGSRSLSHGAVGDSRGWATASRTLAVVVVVAACGLWKRSDEISISIRLMRGDTADDLLFEPLNFGPYSRLGSGTIHSKNFFWHRSSPLQGSCGRTPLRWINMEAIAFQICVVPKLLKLLGSILGANSSPRLGLA